MSVHINGIDYPEGVGKNKKEAKQNAAKNACQILFRPKEENPLTQESDLSSAEPSESHDKAAINFMIKISEYCQKNNFSFDYIKVKTEGPSHNRLFSYKLVIEEKDYPVAQGKTIKEAKQKAAQLAWFDLQQQSDLDSKESGESVSEDQTSESTCSTHTSHNFEKTNFISKISEFCQQNNYSPNYLEVKREGPSHDPLFYIKLVICQKEYPEAQGKTVKEARQNAAKLAYSVLKEQFSLDSKFSDGFAGSDGSDLYAQHKRSSSRDSWVTFKDSSKPSNSQMSSDALDAVSNSGKELSVPSTSTKICSEYDSIKTLGSGSYGFVYKARNKALDTYFAIKEIRTKDPKKALLEAKVLAGLTHPHIVRYYTFWSDDTGYEFSRINSNYKFLFIEMELCDGGNLRRWIREKNKEALENSRRNESLKIALQILSGVEYIHSKKFIHRDLKPENILFGQDGNIRIGDFGLVTQDHDEGEIVERTEDRGTPNYMAPEQIGTNYDRKVDIFALGLIFFELLWRISTGHERVAIWGDVRRQNLPKEFVGTHTVESRIIKTMLNEKPEARPEASALIEELKKWNPEENNDQGNQTI